MLQKLFTKCSLHGSFHTRTDHLCKISKALFLKGTSLCLRRSLRYIFYYLKNFSDFLKIKRNSARCYCVNFIMKFMYCELCSIFHYLFLYVILKGKGNPLKNQKYYSVQGQQLILWEIMTTTLHEHVIFVLSICNKTILHKAFPLSPVTGWLIGTELYTRRLPSLTSTQRPGVTTVQQTSRLCFPLWYTGPKIPMTWRTFHQWL
jgi:hypothetical protein